MARPIRPIRAAGAGLLVILAGCPEPEPEPDPEPDPECADGEVFDGAECVPEACGPGPFGTIGEGEADVFVAESGEEDDAADGSAEHPFGLPDQAIDLLVEQGGGRAAFGTGVWEGLIELGELPGPIELVGRCPELVEFVGEDDAAFVVTESEVTLSGATIRAGAPAVLVSGEDFAGSTSVVLRDVRIVDSVGVGVLVSGLGSVEAFDSAIAGVAGLEEDRTGFGVLVEEGSSFSGTGLAVSAVQGVGVFAEGAGALVELTDSTVTGGLPYADGGEGFGGQADSGARLVATRVVFEENAEFGVFLEGDGTTAAFTDVTITGTLPRADDDEHGFGLFIESGPLLEATGLLLDRNLEANLYMDAASAVIEDSRIANGVPRVDGEGGGYGVDVHNGTDLVLRRVVIEANTDLGVLLEASSGDFEDVEIRGTLPREEGEFGDGVVVQEGGSLTASGLVLEDNANLGLFVTGEGSTATLDGVTIRNQVSPIEGEGTGVTVIAGGAVTATSLTAEGLGGPGVLVAGEATFACTDCAVREATFASVLVYDGAVTWDGGALEATRPIGGVGGVGVAALNDRGPGSVTVTGAELTGHPLSGLYLAQAGGTFRLDGVTVDGGAAEGGAGYGLMALDGVTTWTPADGPGLLVADSAFGDFTSHALVLHEASLSLDGNTFTDVGGFDAFFQGCTTADPEILSGSVDVSGCDGTPVDVDPRLTRVLDFEQLD